MAPIASVQVTRGGGTNAAGVATVYSGTGTSFNDTRLKNGAHYTYTITARDLAGNATVQTIGATPQARLLSPAVERAPERATDAQLDRRAERHLLQRAVVPQWRQGAQHVAEARQPPASPRKWKFQGRRYRLKPGKYRWYVWPGLGRRKAGRYGHMIGSGTFVVVR